MFFVYVTMLLPLYVPGSPRINKTDHPAGLVIQRVRGHWVRSDIMPEGIGKHKTRGPEESYQITNNQLSPIRMLSY